MTFGTLPDEIVRRATGARIAEHVRTLIAEPLGLDMWMGLPDQAIPRVVPGRWDGQGSMEQSEEVHEPGSYVALRRAFLEENPAMDPDFGDPEEVRAHYAAERPGIGAIIDGRGLAAMCAALLDPGDGVRLIGDGTRARVTPPRTDGLEVLVESGTAGPDIRFG